MELNKALERCIVDVSGTLRDALVALDRGSLKVVVISDDRKRVVGLLTDGDVRRAILAGATLEESVDKHMNQTFTAVDVRASRADVLDLMQARKIAEVPVLDVGRRLIGLHSMHDVVGRRNRPNWAVVMAGGRGTRLGSLTNTVPKPMLRVAGRPILERIVLHLAGAGVSQIFIAINYLGHIIEEHFGDGSRFGCSIAYLREESPLGTAGALALLPQKPLAPLLVMNGDLVTQTDLGDLLERHENGSQAVTVGVRRYLHTVPFGCFELDGDRVLAIEEKPTLNKVINAGIYVLDPKLITAVPNGTEYTMPDLLSDALNKGERITVYEIIDDWVDVGQQDQLREARGESP